MRPRHQNFLPARRGVFLEDYITGFYMQQFGFRSFPFRFPLPYFPLPFSFPSFWIPKHHLAKETDIGNKFSNVFCTLHAKNYTALFCAIVYNKPRLTFENRTLKPLSAYGN